MIVSSILHWNILYLNHCSQQGRGPKGGLTFSVPLWRWNCQPGAFFNIAFSKLYPFPTLLSSIFHLQSNNKWWTYLHLKWQMVPVPVLIRVTVQTPSAWWGSCRKMAQSGTRSFLVYLIISTSQPPRCALTQICQFTLIKVNQFF